MAKQSSERIRHWMSSLTLEEKIALVSGHAFMYTNPIPRLGIPSIRMSDGPHGLRVQNEGGDNGVAGSLPATAFPTASCSANTWNPELLRKMGNAMAEEASFYGIDVILGPGVNIKRNPLCGRNFEYFSEDPFLAGRMGAAEVQGIQEKGIGVSLKHFALNNSEHYRFMGDSVCDERALREIYLRQYQYVVKTAHPETIMSAYNQINGVFCSENAWLLKDVLRGEWDYEGMVMTDWGGVKDRVASVKAGNDLEMPGDAAICRKWLFDAVNDKSLDTKDLDFCVENVLSLVEKHLDKEKRENVDWDKHHDLAKEIALEGAVLLKNEGNALPLKNEKSLLILGELFEKMRYQGSGSSMINPTRHVTPKMAFDQNSVDYRYAKGYEEKKQDVNQTLVDEALELAKDYTKVVLFLGLTDYVETEGDDRPHMSLPQNQLALVDALVQAKKEIVVVLYGGSVIELPFANQVQAILHMFLPGQCGGLATYELLFGKVSPSGKLAETWPISYQDVPFGNAFGKTKREVYKESIYVGYRYYSTVRKEVRFPFGQGLSYTTFGYQNLRLAERGNELEVFVDVTNLGEIEGKETVQVYVSLPQKNTHHPLRELKGFAKVLLQPKETKTVAILLRKEDLAYWDTQEKRFVLEDGEYRIQIGKNVNEIVLEESLVLSGEKREAPEKENAYCNLDFAEFTDEKYEELWGIKLPPLPSQKPFTLETSLNELRATFMGRILFNAIVGVARKDLKKAKKMPEGTEKDNKIKGAIFLERILVTNSIRSMSMSSSGAMPYNFAEGFRDLANGHLIKGIKDFLRKIKAPALPIDPKEGK